eukprot:scaffold11714_cov153-Cylindrotheca_fusiformis.AAC.3
MREANRSAKRRWGTLRDLPWMNRIRKWQLEAFFLKSSARSCFRDPDEIRFCKCTVPRAVLLRRLPTTI